MADRNIFVSLKVIDYLYAQFNECFGVSIELTIGSEQNWLERLDNSHQFFLRHHGIFRITDFPQENLENTKNLRDVIA